ncbi:MULTISPECIES: hypothetical protein [Solidesulfovibrio]|uniref:hypothetical protein n=1 Tax=Solidesulfovibrio TaxID=2910984 RepID=UPI001305376A|nr:MULTISPECIES: hypothetical protein [Solidesulfovibrio]
MNTPFIGFRHIAFRHSLGRFGIRSATAALFPVSRRRCAVATGTAQDPPPAIPRPAS